MASYFKKIFYILGDNRGKFWFVGLLFMLVASLDFLGIGLIVPLITFILTPEKIQNLSIYKTISTAFGISSFEQSCIILSISIVIIFMIRNGLFLASNAYVFKYSFTQQINLRKKLFNTYLYLPYEWHLNKNSSHIIQNILTETAQFTNLVMIPFLQIFGNIIILFLLFLLILYQNVIFTGLLILILIIFIGIFFAFSKKVTPNLGKIVSKTNEEMVKNVKEGVGGIKEIKVLGCESYFEQDMDLLGKRYANANTKFRTINFSPKILIELIIITYVISWIIIYLMMGIDVESLIPLMTVVAIAGLRVLPFLNIIMQTINKFHNSQYFIDKLYSDLKNHKKTNISDKKKQKSAFHKEIEIKSIYYKYPFCKNYTLKDISLKIKKNEIIGITGKTGAGKTTFVNILLGLLKHNKGKIILDGKDIQHAKLRGLMAYIPQDIFLLDDTIKKNVAFGIEEKDIDDDKVISSLKAAQIDDFVESLPKKMNTNIGENGLRISGGQRQRLGIARALYHDKEILIFDEATSSLDYKTEKKIQKSIKNLKGKKTLILIAHRLKTLQDCNKIYVLEEGKIIKKSNFEEISKYLEDSRD